MIIATITGGITLNPTILGVLNGAGEPWKNEEL